MIYVFSITKPRFTYTVVSYCFITKPNYKQVFKNNENTVGYYAVLPPGPRGSASIPVDPSISVTSNSSASEFEMVRCCGIDGIVLRQDGSDASDGSNTK